MIEQILENNEKIVWRGKQDFLSVMFLPILQISFIIIVIIGLSYFINLNGNLNNTNSREGVSCTINNKKLHGKDCDIAGQKNIIIMLIFFATIPSIKIFIIPLINLLTTKYFITDKRFIIENGLIGKDIKSIYYDQITKIFVEIGILGKIFGSGNIFINLGEINEINGKLFDIPIIGGFFSKILDLQLSIINKDKMVKNVLIAIKNPYEIYKISQENISYNKETLYSGRADYKYNTDEYKDFIQEAEENNNI